MVKSYLRYEPAAAFGVIASLESNISYDSSGKFLLSPALEKVGVWHVRQGVCSKTLSPSASFNGPSLAVTSIASSPSSLVHTVCVCVCDPFSVLDWKFLEDELNFIRVWIIVYVLSFLGKVLYFCLLYTSPSPRDGLLSRMPSSA